MNIILQARSHWPEILKSAGIPASHLQNKHGPCPICGGKDRFRFDNLEQRGTFYCNNCGAGDGVALLMLFKSVSFNEAVGFLKTYFHGHQPAPRHIKQNVLRVAKNTLKAHSHQLMQKAEYICSTSVDASPDHPYLIQKKIEIQGLKSYKSAIVVELYDGVYNLISLQLIWSADKKRYLKGTPKKGAYSIVGRHKPHQPIIVAEGFATAISIYISTGIPTFIALDSGNIEHALNTILSNFSYNGSVVIAADNDLDEKGLKYAEQAISKLNLKNAQIIMPHDVGHDWNDVFCENGSEAVKQAFEVAL